MNLLQMQTGVVDMVPDLRGPNTSHPMYHYVYPSAGAEATSIILTAANDIVGMFPERFPELNSDWVVGPTISGTNYLTRPSDAIAIVTVKCFQSASVPNLNTDRSLPVTYKTPEVFDVLDKSASSNYPSLWTRLRNLIKVWPTPDTPHVAYLHFFGPAREVALVNPTDTLLLDAAWHNDVVELAAAYLFGKMGRIERKEAMAASVRNHILGIADNAAIEQGGRVTTFGVEGTPDRYGVNRSRA